MFMWDREITFSHSKGSDGPTGPRQGQPSAIMWAMEVVAAGPCCRFRDDCGQVGREGETKKEVKSAAIHKLAPPSPIKGVGGAGTAKVGARKGSSRRPLAASLTFSLVLLLQRQCSMR